MKNSRHAHSVLHILCSSLSGMFLPEIKSTWHLNKSKKQHKN